MLIRMVVMAAALGLACALPADPARAAAAPPQDEEISREVYTGALIVTGGPQSGRTATFKLVLTGRTGRQQVQRYASLLRTQGQSALLTQLEDRDVGTFSVEGQPARTVNFAYMQDGPRGRKLLVLFERWLRVSEIRGAMRSQSYPFTYLELNLDDQGRGSGSYIGAAKVYFRRDDPDTLTVENFGTQPFRVVNVVRDR